MGLFKKTPSDIEKFRAAQDVKKLTDALTSKDPDTAIAALRALLEINRPESFEAMIPKIAASSHLSLQREFHFFMSRDAVAFSKLLAEALIAELKRLVESGNLLAQSKQYIEGSRPGSLPILQGWLLDFKEASAPEIRKLLHHKVFLVQTAAAEMLEKWGDPGTRAATRALLERRDIVFMDLKFYSQVLNNSMEFGEIPLAYVHGCTLTIKLAQFSLYTLGLTDEAMHIQAEYGDFRFNKRGSWRIPYVQIKTLFVDSSNHLVMELDSPVVDPENLTGPATSRIVFKPWKKKDVLRAARIVELFGRLKKADLKKDEIVKAYFDKKNVSILEG